jgi:hypothetical protein
MAKRAFISFDFDHDEDLRNLLAGQAKHPDTPFDFANWSVKEPMTGDGRGAPNFDSFVQEFNRNQQSGIVGARQHLAWPPKASRPPDGVRGPRRLNLTHESRAGVAAARKTTTGPRERYLL